jgi:polyhydroxyalkanoate synthesis regulator phasin
MPSSRKAKAIQNKTRKVADEQIAVVTGKAVGTWDRLEQVFEDRVARALSSLGVPSKKDIDKLSKRVAELTSVVQKLTEAQEAAEKAVAKSAAKAVAKPAASKPCASGHQSCCTQSCSCSPQSGGPAAGGPQKPSRQTGCYRYCGSNCFLTENAGHEWARLIWTANHEMPGHDRASATLGEDKLSRIGCRAGGRRSARRHLRNRGQCRAGRGD